MQTILEQYWGSGEHLDPLQMAIRAAILFFVTLILIRLGGMRIFGTKSALDEIIIIMLGAVLARGVVGASPAGSTIVAAAVMIAINRLLAWLSFRSKTFSHLVKGQPLPLYEEGRFIHGNMRKACLSEADLMSCLRQETHSTVWEEVGKAYMETNGRISFILKDH